MDYSLVAVHKVLIAVASLVGFRHTGSVAVAHSLSTACGIFPDQGSKPCLLHWLVDSSPLSHQESPWFSFIRFINMFLEFIHFPLIVEFVGI